MRLALIVVTVAMVVMTLITILGLSMTTPPDFFIVWLGIAAISVIGGVILIKVLLE